MQKPRSTSRRARKARIWRCSLIGAGIFGALGFIAGVGLCLIYKLPIPPLFLTELSGLAGGCLGALIGVQLEAWAPVKSRSGSGARPEENDLY